MYRWKGDPLPPDLLPIFASPFDTDSLDYDPGWMWRELEMKGHRVRVVHHGAAALEAFQEEVPEVILLDIGLPRMDGLEVARRIRAMPDGGNVVICAVTGWGQERDQRRSAEAGFDIHLTKPVDLARLEAVLRDA